jgi:hypothetical protein
MKEPKAAVFWESGGDVDGDDDGSGSGVVGGGRSVVFTKRLQMGFVVGFLMNLLFGM